MEPPPHVSSGADASGVEQAAASGPSSHHDVGEGTIGIDNAPTDFTDRNTNSANVAPPLGMTRPTIKRRSESDATITPQIKSFLRRTRTIDARRAARQVRLTLRRSNTRSLQEAKERELRTATYQLLLQQFQLRKFTIQDGMDFSHTNLAAQMQTASVLRGIVGGPIDADPVVNAAVGQEVCDHDSDASPTMAEPLIMTEGCASTALPLADSSLAPTPAEPTLARTGSSTRSTIGTNRRKSERHSDSNATTAALADRLASNESFSQSIHRNSNSIHRTTSRTSFRKRPRLKKRRSQRFSMRRLVRRKQRRLAKWLKRTGRRMLVPFSPVGVVAQIRVVMLTLVFVVQLVYVPLVPAYFGTGATLSETEAIGIRVTNIIIEIVLLFDVLCTLNTSVYDANTGEMVVSRAAIFLVNIRRWLLPDLLSSIPIDLIRWINCQPLISTNSNAIANDKAIASVVVHSVLQFPRFVSTVQLVSRMWNICRMLRIGKWIYTWLFYSRYSHLMRIVRMVLLVLLTAHYIGCGWHLVTGENNLNAPNAVPPGSPMLDQYVADVYYAMLLIQGQGDPSNTTVQQNAYAIVAVLLGSLMVAIVFANITVLVSNFSANSTNYQRKMEVVHATMDKMQLPHELQERVQRYYSHLWQQYDSLDGHIDKFLKELTPTLALEVGLFKHMSLITKVPFWSSCSPDFMAHVVRNLVVQVYMPDDYVVRRGEVRRELFMINRGLCERSNAVTLFDRPVNDPGAESASDTNQRDRRHSASASGSDTNSNPNKMMSNSALIPPADAATAAMLFQDQQDGQWPRRVGLRRQNQRKKRRRVARTMYHASTTVSDSDVSSSDDSSRSDSSDRSSVSSRGGIHGLPRGDSWTFHESSPSRRRLSSSVSAVVKPEEPIPGTLRLSTGHAFGEMSVLVNYEQPASVRAVTYVEMCILHRDVFQLLLVQFPDDRREVLANMLRHSVERRELPLSWTEVCDLIAAQRGVPVTNLDAKSFTTDEIVEVLVEMIDHEEVDQSILFGFPDMATRFAQSTSATQRSSSSDGVTIMNTNTETRLAILRAFLPTPDGSLASQRSISSFTMGTDRTQNSTGFSRHPIESAYTTGSSSTRMLLHRRSLTRSNSNSIGPTSSRTHSGRDPLATLSEQMNRMSVQLQRLVATQDRLIAFVGPSVVNAAKASALHHHDRQHGSTVRKVRSASALPVTIAAAAAALAAATSGVMSGSSGPRLQRRRSLIPSLRPGYAPAVAVAPTSAHRIHSTASQPVRPSLRRSFSTSVPMSSGRPIRSPALPPINSRTGLNEAEVSTADAASTATVEPSAAEKGGEATTLRSGRSGRLLLSRRSMVETTTVARPTVEMTLVDQLWSAPPPARDVRGSVDRGLPALAEEERQRKHRDSVR
jgi:CRP-like cAMP-binding protein